MKNYTEKEFKDACEEPAYVVERRAEKEQEQPPFETTPEDWREFEEDFAIAVEMMSQGLDGKTPDYQSAKRAVRAEAGEMRRQSAAIES